MAKQPLPLADLATHYARTLQGDSTASDYLSSQGLQVSKRVKLTGKHDAQSPTQVHKRVLSPEEAALQTNNQMSPKNSSKQQEPFDFPIFLVTGKSTKNRQKEEVLTGPPYDSRVDISDVPMPEKPPIESFQLTSDKLKAALENSAECNRIDISKLTRKVAKQEWIRELPLQAIKTEPEHLRIVIDKSTDSVGWVRDAFHFAQKLTEYWQDCNTEVLVLKEGPQGQWGFKGEELQQNKLPQPDSDSIILIIAGFHRDSHPAWLSLLSQWHKRASEILWLTPVLPAQQEQAELPVTWLPWGRQHISIEAARQFDIESLMALAMTLAYIPGALLRRLVQSLGLPVKCEREFIQHPDISYDPGSDYCQIGPLSQSYRQVLKSRLEGFSAKQISQLNNIIETYLTPLSQSLVHEHRIALHLNCPKFQCENIEQSYQHFARMGVSLKQQSADQKGIALFLANSMQRFGDEIENADGTLKQTLGRACKYLTDNQLDNNIPASLVEYVLQPDADPHANQQQLEIRQQGQKLVLAGPATEQKQTHNFTSNVVASLKANATEPLFIQETDADGRPVSDLRAIYRKLPEKLPKDFILHSQFESLSISRRTSEDFWWAHKVNCDWKGIVVETDDIKLTFFYDLSETSWIHSIISKRFGDKTLNENIQAKKEAPQWIRHAIKRPTYSPFYIGVDDYGLFGSFNLEGAEFTMRYIPPGSFLMGSPDDEPERLNSETLHPVTLTKGFWIGETTVTQKLWQAVMGDNPSHFKAQDNEELAVEQVSWHDCQAFCKKLSELTGANFTLPTEAQWEYACRAGTTTPFNTGEQLGYEQGNYDVNYPYNGREKLVLQSGQEYRDKTLDVHRFEANKWGLKQMHGNVWEWCMDDWNEVQSTEHCVDPLQSGDEAAWAVLRGGGWHVLGRRCRSAYRSHFRRDFRLNSIGLRVTQVIEEAEPDE